MGNLHCLCELCWTAWVSYAFRSQCECVHHTVSLRKTLQCHFHVWMIALCESVNRHWNHNRQKTVTSCTQRRAAGPGCIMPGVTAQGISVDRWVKTVKDPRIFLTDQHLQHNSGLNWLIRPSNTQINIEYCNEINIYCNVFQQILQKLPIFYC